MRKGVFFLVLCLWLSAAAAWGAPVNEFIPFQKSTTLTAGTYTIRFSLWTAMTGGAQVWYEEKNVTTTGPVVKTNLGQTTDFSAVDFSQQLFVQVEKKEANLSYTVLGGRTRLFVVPYAIWSAGAGSADTGGSVTSVTAGKGLMPTWGTDTTGDVILNVGPGSGISVDEDTVSVATGGINTTMLAAGAVTNAKLADGSVTTTKIADAAVTLSKIDKTGAAANQALTYNGSTLGWQSIQLGLPYSGAGSAAGNLFSITNSGGGNAIYGVSTISSGYLGGEAGAYGATSDSYGVGTFGISTGLNGDGVKGVADNGTDAYGVHGMSSAGVGVVGATSTGYAGQFYGKSYFSGNVGLGTLSPAARLHVKGAGFPDSFLYLDTTAAGQDSGIRLYENGTVKSHLYWGASAGTLKLYGSGGSGIDVTSAGSVGIGTATPGARLQAATSSGTALYGTSTTGIGVYAYGSGTGTGAPSLFAYNPNATATAPAGIAIFAKNSSGDTTIVAQNTGAGDTYRSLNKDGNVIIFRVTSTGRVVTTAVQITGGGDLAERFEISKPKAAPEPAMGMLVSIDPVNPGKLVVSRKAYDRTVAGIISGAGGINSGMVMGQEGTIVNGAHNVALTGRVYCMADASTGKINPGDLLTTSDIPGHAMKVTDYSKAQGAIIGKAMSSLSEGQGMVLVLVTLQ